MTNFESDKSPAEFANIYKEDGLVGGWLEGQNSQDIYEQARKWHVQINYWTKNAFRSVLN